MWVKNIFPPCLGNLSPRTMLILQNVLSDYFQKAEQGRLTRGPPMKRVKPFSSLRPWCIPTRPVKQISTCGSVLFLECVLLLCTDPSVLTAQCVVWPLICPWISSLPSTPVISLHTPGEPPLFSSYIAKKGKPIEVLPSFRHGCS